MAEKKSPNKVMLVIVLAVVVLFVVMVSLKRAPKYDQLHTLPRYEERSQPKDGDTQADTIRALQAYAKEAVGKAETLNEATRQQQTTVLENRNKVGKLEKANVALTDATQKMSAYANALASQLTDIHQQLAEIQARQNRTQAPMDDNGIPVGFGFDALQQQRHQDIGKWHDPLDTQTSETEGKNRGGFSGLLAPPTKPASAQHTLPAKTKTHEKGDGIVPVFTLPKDTILYDAIALTALIGRIPVDGITPDPYPVKILIGKENLAANGFELPDVAGMLFSGVGVGDWNLSCVNARLYSATYIFDNGQIVNHTSEATPLGYISDRHGWPCVVGEFKTNAPRFLRDRIGLAGLGAAGSAYAAAQFSRHENATNGATTRFTGSADKLLAGTIVQSATEEASQWILDRQKQSFDAVIVEPGAAVSIHLNQALTLDENTLNRHVRYARNAPRARRHLD